MLCSGVFVVAAAGAAAPHLFFCCYLCSCCSIAAAILISRWYSFFSLHVFLFSLLCFVFVGHTNCVRHTSALHRCIAIELNDCAAAVAVALPVKL